MKGENTMILSREAVEEALVYWLNHSVLGYDHRIVVKAMRVRAGGEIALTVGSKTAAKEQTRAETVTAEGRGT